jgi:hypothetical protein
LRQTLAQTAADQEGIAGVSAGSRGGSFSGRAFFHSGGQLTGNIGIQRNVLKSARTSLTATRSGSHRWPGPDLQLQVPFCRRSAGGNLDGLMRLNEPKHVNGHVPIARCQRFQLIPAVLVRDGGNGFIAGFGGYRCTRERLASGTDYAVLRGRQDGEREEEQQRSQEQHIGIVGEWTVLTAFWR